MITLNKLISFFYHCLFFIVPLIFAFNTSELFEFNKIIFIYSITVLIVFLWLIKMIVTKKIIFKKTVLDIPLFIFLSSQILSTIFSIDKHTSIFGYYGRFNGGLISTLSYILLYYGFVSNIDNLTSFLKTSLISSFLVILYAIPGKLGHDLTCFLASKGKIIDNSCWDNSVLQFRPEIRTFSTLGQPNWFGAYLAINFFIGLYFLLKNLQEKKLLFYFLNLTYLFLNFTFILFSRSKSAIGGTIFSFGLFFIFYFLFIKKNFKNLVFLLISIIILPIIFFKTGIEKIDKYLIIKNQSQKIIKNEKSSLEIKNNKLNITDSFDIRKIVWQGAINLGLKYPFFGTGVETFAYSYYFVRPKEHNLTSEWDFVYNKAHNEFLNYFATTGFFGLTSYLFLIFNFYFLFFKKILELDSNKNSHNNFQSLILISLSTAYTTILITNFFGFSTTTINLFFYLIPGFLIVLENKKQKEKIFLKIENLNFNQYFSILIIFLLASYILLSIFIYYLADVYYTKGLNYTKIEQPDYQKSALYFQKALKLRYEPIYEDRLSHSFAYLALIASYQKQSEISKKFIFLSDYYNKKTLNNFPKNIFFWKTRIKNQYYFYQITLDNNYLSEGIKAILEAKKLAPTDPKIYYTSSFYYSLLYDIEKDINKKNLYLKKSLEEINHALKLKKDFQDGIDFKKELIKKYQL